MKKKMSDLANAFQVFAFWTVGILAFLITGLYLYLSLLFAGIIVLSLGSFIMLSSRQGPRYTFILIALIITSVIIGLGGLFVAMLGGG